MSISILDMPSEILEKIFLMVEGDFEKNPFLIIEKGKLSQMCKSILENFTRSDADYGRYNEIKEKYNNLYKLYCRNNPVCVLPSTLCILSRVCKTINKDINDTNKCWETVYIRDLRKGKNYVYPKKPVFYINKYRELIKDYYIPLLNNIKLIKSKDDKNLLVKYNNSNIYLDSIKYCVDNLLIDSNRKYEVQGLYKLRTRHALRGRRVYDTGQHIIDEVTQHLCIETIIKKRRQCLRKINELDERIKLNGLRISKYKKIVDSLSDENC